MNPDPVRWKSSPKPGGVGRRRDVHHALVHGSGADVDLLVSASTALISGGRWAPRLKLVVQTSIDPPPIENDSESGALKRSKFISSNRATVSSRVTNGGQVRTRS